MCNHKSFHTIKNVGFDVDSEGEEYQHIDKCNKCKAWRFRMWYQPIDRPGMTHLEEWTEDELPWMF